VDLDTICSVRVSDHARRAAQADRLGQKESTMHRHIETSLHAPRPQMLTRRLVLRGLGAGGAAAALAGIAVNAARAQDATPDAIPPALAAWSAAWDADDPDAVAASYTEDGTAEDVPSGQVSTGRAEIAAATAAVMSGTSEASNTPVAGFSAGDQAVLEFQVDAVDAASGQPFTFRGVLVADLDGDLIRSSREYYDVATILGQLGLLGGPPPDATPEP
jgi:uncharacterized protein (TIGR02246 family)